MNYFKKKFLIKDKSQKGFTLVELIVAVGIFISIFTIVTALFISSLKAQRFLTRLMSVNNNVGIILEQMAREIRTGYKFQGTLDSCSNNISFLNSQESDPFNGGDASTSYSLNNGAIERNGIILTSSNVEVKNLCFKLIKYNGLGNQECNPPRILITMGVMARGSNNNDKISYIETVVSSRVLPTEIKNDPYVCRTQ